MMTGRFWFVTLVVICDVVLCSPLWPLINKSNKLTDCQTQECIRSASSILKNMNNSANPCEDFYNFACGSYIKLNSIPGHKASVDQFSKISDSIKRNIRIVLEKPIKKEELIPFTLAKQFYQSCMDTVSIEKYSLQNLRDVLARVGGWPVLDKDWDESHFVWYDTIHKFRKEGLGFGYLLDFRVNVDVQNTSKRIISITQPSLSLHRKHLMQGFESTEVRNYFDYMVDVVISLGADLETAQRDISDSMYFEMEIAKLSLSSEEKRVPLTLVSPVAFTQKRFPGIPWLHFLNGILLTPNNITEDEVISVASLAYVGNLTSLVNHYPKRIVANYLIRRAIGSLIRYMPKKFRDFQFRFSSQTTGVKTMLPRWEDCFNVMMSIMPLTLGIIYVREYFSEERRQEAQDIVDNIVKHFHVGLDELDWMDEATRMRAKEKSRNITTLIGYPDELLNDTIVTNHYNGLTLTSDHLMENILNLWLFSATKTMESLHMPVIKGDWRGHGKAATVNAYYNYVKHAVEFSAGIFQGAFFHKDRPKYLNYGAIGPVIGHEVSHGFDDTGSRLNAGGNLENWWDSKTKQQFLQRAQCFIDQYGNIRVPEVNQTINGVNSQGEIIADNGGLKSSYKAYLKWEREHGPELKLPGLNFTSHQLFWISYANTGCEKLRPKALALKVLASNHPPYKYRVNGALSNNDDFARDFNCPEGTPMNPTESDECRLTIFNNEDSCIRLSSYHEKGVNSDRENTDDSFSVKKSGVQELVEDLARSPIADKQRFELDKYTPESLVRKRKSGGIHKQRKKHTSSGMRVSSCEEMCKQDESKEVKPKFDFLVSDDRKPSEPGLKLKLPCSQKISRGMNTKQPDMCSVHAQTGKVSRRKKMKMLISENFDISLPTKVTASESKEEQIRRELNHGKQGVATSAPEDLIMENGLDNLFLNHLKQTDEQIDYKDPDSVCGASSENEGGTESSQSTHKVHKLKTRDKSVDFPEETKLQTKSVEETEDQCQPLKFLDEETKDVEKITKRTIIPKKHKKENKTGHDIGDHPQPLKFLDEVAKDLEKTTKRKKTAKKETKSVGESKDQSDPLKLLDEQNKDAEKTSKKMKRSKKESKLSDECKDNSQATKHVEKQTEAAEKSTERHITVETATEETQECKESVTETKPLSKPRPKSAKPSSKSCTKKCRRVERPENAEFMFAELNLRCKECKKFKNSYLYLQKRLRPVADECFQCWEKWQQEIYPKVMDFPTTRRSIPLVQGVTHYY